MCPYVRESCDLTWRNPHETHYSKGGAFFDILINTDQICMDFLLSQEHLCHIDTFLVYYVSQITLGTADCFYLRSPTPIINLYGHAMINTLDPDSFVHELG